MLPQHYLSKYSLILHVGMIQKQNPMSSKLYRLEINVLYCTLLTEASVNLFNYQWLFFLQNLTEKCSINLLILEPCDWLRGIPCFLNCNLVLYLLDKV